MEEVPQGSSHTVVMPQRLGRGRSEAGPRAGLSCTGLSCIYFRPTRHFRLSEKPSYGDRDGTAPGCPCPKPCAQVGAKSTDPWQSIATRVHFTSEPQDLQNANWEIFTPGKNLSCTGVGVGITSSGPDSATRRSQSPRHCTLLLGVAAPKHRTIWLHVWQHAILYIQTHTGTYKHTPALYKGTHVGIYPCLAGRTVSFTNGDVSPKICPN